MIDKIITDKSIYNDTFWEFATVKMQAVLDKDRLGIMKICIMPADVINDRILLNYLFSISCRSMSTHNLLINAPDKWGAKLIWPYSINQLINIEDWSNKLTLLKMADQLNIKSIVKKWPDLNIEELGTIYPKTYKKLNKYYTS